MNTVKNGILDTEDLRIELPKIIDQLEKKFPYAHALFESEHGLSIAISSKEKSVSPLSPIRGLVLTACGEEGLQEVAVDRVSGADLTWATEELLLRAAHSDSSVQVDPGPPLAADFTIRPIIDPKNVSLDDKIEACTSLEQRLREYDSRVISAGVSYSERWIDKFFVNRTRILHQKLLLTTFAGRAVISDGSTTRVARVGNSWSAGFEKVNVSDDEISESIDVAIRLLTAPRLTPGKYKIIGGPMMAGVIAHEAFGHGVEADLFLKNRAEAAKYLGKQVASEIVDM